MKAYTALTFALAIIPALALPQQSHHSPLSMEAPDPTLSVSVDIGGRTFVNKGLVAFGLIPHDAKDQYGETIGGIGSAIALKRGTFLSHPNGTFSGKFVVQPDRGYNVEQTIDWQTRQHTVGFTLKPYYSASNLPFTEAQKTLQFEYLSTTLYSFHDGSTSGADPQFVTTVSGSSIKYPAVKESDRRLTTDPEGLVQNKDGSFWMSDEYGPYIYLVSDQGEILKTITPPDAVIPRINGVVDFTSLRGDPDTGRGENKGFEGLTASASGDKLYGMLQSALMQDGGGSKKTNRYTRLFKWNVHDLDDIKLEAEYVIPLPQSSKPETYANSEIHWLNKDQFLVLARDGNGNGDKSAKSDYKAIDVFDVSSATNIAGTDYDLPAGSISPGGRLAPSITPATYTPFVQFIDRVQLARFGLHNGKPVDETLINAKWESIALAPVGDHEHPDDYFLFSFSDNDFQTKNGVAMGKPYSATLNEDSQVLVWRVTLPTVARGSVEEAIGI